jgi:DeoR/GlpR family transcriptional regulator of sugar metabolism
MNTSEALLEMIRTRAGASVAEIRTEFDVSEATVRRALRRLAASGEIVRTYGGALPARPLGGVPTTEQVAEKVRIGRVAAALIEDGDTVVIGSGSTALEVARNLIGRSDLTIITNALDVVGLLIDLPGIDLIVLGGLARVGMHSLLGHLTELAACELRADKLVVGIAAFDFRHGLTSDYMPEIVVDRALRAMSREVIIVADSSKCGRVEAALVSSFSEVDVLVSDTDLPNKAQEDISALGVRVVLA